MKPRRPWIVTPHGPLEKLSENLWAVESQVPGISMRRRMMIVKRSDGKLLFFHAVPLEEAALAEVKAWGEPAYLVIAHDAHGVDGDAFQKKLNLKLYGPKANEAAMRKKFDVDGVFEDIPKDPSFEVVTLSGTKKGEPVIVVRSAGGASALFSDAMMNVAKAPFPMSLLGFAGGPKCTPIFRWFYMSDKRALRASFEQLAATPGLKTLVPCHGDVVAEGGAQVLKDIAATL